MPEDSDHEVASANGTPDRPRKRKHKQRFNRSKTGCLSCRRRKIRCDEAHPICERCMEVKAECIWPSDPSSSSSRTSPVPTTNHFMTTLDSAFLAIDTASSHAGGNGGGRYAGAQSSGQNEFEARMMEEMFGTTHHSAGNPSGSGLRLSDLSMPQYDTIGPTAQSSTHSTRPYPNNQVGTADLANLYGAYTFSDLFTPMGTPIATPKATIANYVPPLQTSSQLAISTSAPNGHVALNPLSQISTTAPISITNSALASRRGTNTSAYPVMMQLPLSIPPVIEEPIEHTFPSADSKRLFQHVRSKTSTVIVALGMGTHEAKNPFMAMVTRLMRVDPKSAAQTAFRHSLLSLGSAHVCHQHHLSSPDQCQQMRVRTVKSKRKATLHLFMPSQKQEEGYTDLLLATCLTLHLRNKLWADTLWKQSLEIAIRHITRFGGPGPLLALSNQHCDRRFMLEQLAVADVFSTFTTGDEPLLLGQDAAWWEDGSQGWSESQWESYERYLGISREMTRIIAQYRVIMARNFAMANDDGPKNKASRAAKDGLVDMSNERIEALRLWSAGQVNIPRRRRIMNGDSAYRYMMVMSLLVEVQAVDIADARIQAATRSVLELCSEMSQEPVNLLWPLLTAGSCCITEEDRNWVRRLFSTSKDEYCKDLEIANILLHEQWTRLDCGKPFTPWPTLMADLRHQVCLM